MAGLLVLVDDFVSVRGIVALVKPSRAAWQHCNLAAWQRCGVAVAQWPSRGVYCVACAEPVRHGIVAEATLQHSSASPAQRAILCK